MFKKSKTEIKLRLLGIQGIREGEILCMCFKLEMQPEKESVLVNHWNSLTYKPKVIVFDLDGTLWPYYVDCDFSPPYTKRETSKGHIVLQDGLGEKRPYEDVTWIIRALKEKCLPSDGHLAIASIATEEMAKPAIELFGWTKFLSSSQIYYKSKSNHMKAIKGELGFQSFGEVLFYDDEASNYEPTTSLGVTMHLLDNRFGLNLESLLKGLSLFDEKKKLNLKN